MEAAVVEYEPPRRLRHARAFLYRQLSLPGSVGGEDYFLTLHSAGSLEAETPSNAAFVSGPVRSTHSVEFAAPLVGPLAPPGAPLDARLVVFTLRCRVLGGSAVLARCEVDFEALQRLPGGAEVEWPANTLLVRLSDGHLFSPPGLLPEPGEVCAEAAPAEARSAQQLARWPGAQLLPWCDVRWDLQRLLGARAAATHARARAGAAQQRAAAALSARALRGCTRARVTLLEVQQRLQRLQEDSLAARRRAADLGSQAVVAQARCSERAAALEGGRQALRARQVRLSLCTCDATSPYHSLRAQSQLEAYDAPRAALGVTREALSALLRALCHARWHAVRTLCLVYPITGADAAPMAPTTDGCAAAAPLRIAGCALDHGGATAHGGGAVAYTAGARESGAAALGYACACVLLLERILGVPLRYALRPCGSRSQVCDRASAALALKRGGSSFGDAGDDSPGAWQPLYGSERARAAAAVGMLNSNVEQLCISFALAPAGSILASLARLTAAAHRPSQPSQSIQYK